MNINVQSQGLDAGQAVDQFVRSALQSALRPFVENVVTVDVHMKDANGPKGGVDKHVVVRARLRNRQVVMIETRHDNLYAAIKAGSKRTRRAVRRHLRRSRHIRKVRFGGSPDRIGLPTVT